ncbi:MAG: hypothetical protein U0164_09510 [Gemmatimonadaceae bacterium]
MRALKASAPPAITTRAPAFCRSAAVFLPRAEEREVTRDVVERPDQYVRLRGGDLVRDLPTFGRGRQRELQVELARDIERHEQVARPVGVDGERNLAPQHRLQRLEIDRTSREGTRCVRVEPAASLWPVARFRQDGAQALVHFGARRATVVPLGPDVGEHRGRPLEQDVA